MPFAVKTSCAVPGCPNLVDSGRCTAHRRQVEQHRGSAAARGYDSRWQAFRPVFIQMLIDAGIAPVCGATLLTGPRTEDSLCKLERLHNGSNLHLDHEPPLTAAERMDPRVVCDPTRIQLLCGPRCHQLKTRRQAQAVVGAGTHD